MLKKALFVTATLFVAVIAFAQDPAPLPVPVDQNQALVLALFSAALPFGVALLRKAIPTLPRMVVWAAAPLLGTAIGWVSGVGGMTGWKGFLAGLAAIGLREAVSTFQQHGING